MITRSSSLMERLQHFMNPFDGRYEGLAKGNTGLNIFRDFTAGLIVAMVAIPLAMGFAIASGLRPEQGILGGAIAGLVGALFGGSKYQVYGPTAAFIPIIAGIVAAYNYSGLILISIIAGVILCTMGLARLGRLAAMVPHSVIVGFTIGIAIVIGFSQVGEVLGIKAALGSSIPDKIAGIWRHAEQINLYALLIAVVTFTLSKLLLRVSVFIPAPLIGIGVATLLSMTVFADAGLMMVKDKFGSIPTDLWVVTLPALPALNATIIADMAYYVIAVVFVAAVESLLCSRMADRLAENRGQPYDPNKELWGQGLVNIIVPLLNGFPHTGALARTATNIKVGAMSPLAGIFKCVLKLLLAVYLARYLELIPMAAIGGILFYVATGMVKAKEVKEVLSMGRFHIGLGVYTAVMVPMTDFLTGVLSALIIFGVHQTLRQPLLQKFTSRGNS